MQRSDCQDSCIVGDSYILPDAVCAGLLQRIAPWQTNPGSPDWERTMCLSMPRPPTPPGLRRPCQYGRRSVAFRALGPRRHPEVAYFGAQYWAYTSSVNASRTTLLPLVHDSRPGWLARPSLLGTYTPSIVPVLIGAPQRPAFSRAALIDRENCRADSRLQNRRDLARRTAASARMRGWAASSSCQRAWPAQSRRAMITMIRLVLAIGPRSQSPYTCSTVHPEGKARSLRLCAASDRGTLASATRPWRLRTK
jgi:hypothetical protein